jgi:hypothetical protein
MVWADRATQERHFCLIRSVTTLAVITPQTGTYQVFPGILSSAGLRENMIHGQRDAACTTVLTTMVITSQDILS